MGKVAKGELAKLEPYENYGLGPEEEDVDEDWQSRSLPPNNPPNAARRMAPSSAASQGPIKPSDELFDHFNPNEMNDETTRRRLAS